MCRHCSFFSSFDLRLISPRSPSAFVRASFNNGELTNKFVNKVARQYSFIDITIVVVFSSFNSLFHVCLFALEFRLRYVTL